MMLSFLAFHNYKNFFINKKVFVNNNNDNYDYVCVYVCKKIVCIYFKKLLTDIYISYIMTIMLLLMQLIDIFYKI